MNGNCVRAFKAAASRPVKNVSLGASPRGRQHRDRCKEDRTEIHFTHGLLPKRTAFNVALLQDVRQSRYREGTPLCRRSAYTAGQAPEKSGQLPKLRLPPGSAPNQNKCASLYQLPEASAQLYLWLFALSHTTDSEPIVPTVTELIQRFIF
jgi:hypothetical protein